MLNFPSCCSAPFEGFRWRDDDLGSNLIQVTDSIQKLRRRCSTMKKVCEVALVGLLGLSSSYGMHGQAAGATAVDSDVNAASARDGLTAIPPLPRGKSTILGGSIRDVDPVLDRFTLGIVGEKPMRILFDERTQLFIDGKKVPLRDLRPSSHASVQTTLD